MQAKLTRCCFALAVIMLLAITHPVDAQHHEMMEEGEKKPAFAGFFE
ncbi:hypothetical protein QTP81_16355 [Alteromonas sp. ASW11-36]|uniref:Uncharacterized protein n=1 Tax=Alteromonas arenosi TaxID=3055817 RepID=A0ABT7T157_9ALTE|nr:hypothetical protein [Alteromonas sp. ASW11-36]MDM7862179.1 hypothetical protein [Alteromonas sp. ASW11-36]